MSALLQTWLVDTLIATGGLIALVLILRAPVARWFGPGAAYALWALPLLRLFVPPLVLPGLAEARLPAAQDAAVVTMLPAATTPLPVTDWAGLALVVWLIGAAAFLLRRSWNYAAMRRALLSGAQAVGQVGRVRLVETAATAGPVAFGVRDPVIALPPGFMAQADRTARDLALAHELEHHAARDLAVNLAMQPLLALHWFNPLAWLAWKALRRDQEAACDARVLAGRDPATRAAYGHLIARFARHDQRSLSAALACPIALEKSIVHRLRSLTMQDTSLRRRLLGRALIGAGALALPLTATITYAASDSAPAAPVSPAAQAAPAAPAAPVAPADPAAPRIERQVMIIDHPEGASPDDPALVTRTITRDGRTIVFKSAKPLSEAEIEQRVDQALASIPEIPEPPLPPVAPGDAKREVRRVMVISGSEGSTANLSGGEAGRTAVIIGDHAAPAAAGSAVQISCNPGTRMSRIEADNTAGERRETVRMHFCHKDGSPADQVAALRKAREQMAANTKLSDATRQQVLKQLDDEIARLSNGG